MNYKYTRQAEIYLFIYLFIYLYIYLFFIFFIFIILFIYTLFYERNTANIELIFPAALNKWKQIQ
jgi:hypothetical protein